MLRYELSISEIMSFDVFISICEKKKQKRKEGKKREKLKQKAQEKKEKTNKRQIQLISFSCGKHFVVRS